MFHLSATAFLLLFFNGVVNAIPPKPNIVMIVSDDMGFNDIGFHGSDQIPTPNIDALAAYGINLNRYYVSPMCTPSRASLMTGKYSSSVGMQNYVIVSEQPYGLGLSEKIMPEYLKEAGYKTHIVGKWHLGFYKKEYTPTLRGFDSHIGYLGPYIDYYNHSLDRPNLPDFESGYDMRKNLDLYRESLGTYATDLFTQESIKIIQNHSREDPLFLYIPHLAPHSANGYDPLQAPQEIINKFAHIKDEKRRTYAAMVSALDDSIGNVVNALKENQMLDNSVILFFCDNGATIEIEHSNGGSNSPLKGQKQSPWEGAVRSAGVIWSPLLENRERTSTQLFHISDWLPTFASLAGVTIDETDRLDGKNIWPALSYNLNSPRQDALCHLDDTDGYQSYINGDFKYVNGTTYNGIYDHWMDYVDETEKHSSFNNYGESIMNSTVGRALSNFATSNLNALTIEKHRQSSIITCNNVPIPTDKQYQCRPLEAPCLFNIVNDPCERRNIAPLRPVTLRMMQNEIDKLRLKALPIRNKPGDERSNPAYFENTWTWWYDELGIPDYEESDAAVKTTYSNILITAILNVLCAVVQHL
ncbi:arylsulfatase B-like isoform X2 [Bradysia coprophila]|uniref:arylsulfatase B-like isoform X2 n=1 Tax=Bradysia coprophila TaxID=38358 RepID=UPI00187DD24D|nr:arylsulfatase B-like isoform X2 [Bradysia coprophila]